MSQSVPPESAPLESISDTDIDYRELDDIIEKEYNLDKENLIMILQAIQRRYNFLPRPALAYLSTKLDIPFTQSYGVATFYSTFSLEPRGRNVISICLGTACHVRGAEKIREKIEGTLNIRNGETTADQRFTLETVHCLGGCSFGPMVKINEDMYGRNTSEKTDDILDQYE